MTTLSSVFVNRESEKKLIFDKLNLMADKQRLVEFILLISGIPGIGKTSLLNHIRYEITQLQFKVALIDMDDAQFLPNKESYLFEKIASQLFIPIASWQQALLNYQHYGLNEDGRHKDTLVNQIVDNFNIILKQQPVALLIDNSHYLDDTTQKILEEILDGTRDLDRLFVVLTGRRDLRWHNFELNRCSRLINLPALEKKAAMKLVDHAYFPLAESFYQITKGYPLALTQANKWVKANFEADDPQLLDKVNHRERDLVSTLIKSIFEQHILGHISDLENPELIGEIIKNISPLRRFDDYLLFELLSQSNNIFSKINALQARSYMRQMSTKTYLVKWDRGSQAYVIDNSIRQLLMLNMKHEQVEKLAQIHKFMLDWYQNAIIGLNTIAEDNKKSKSNPQSVVYLIEQLYHELQLNLLQKNSDDIESRVQVKIELYFKDYEWRERNHFFEEFSNDVDLQELLGEGHRKLLTKVEQLVNESV